MISQKDVEPNAILEVLKQRPRYPENTQINSPPAPQLKPRAAPFYPGFRRTDRSSEDGPKVRDSAVEAGGREGSVGSPNSA